MLKEYNNYLLGLYINTLIIGHNICNKLSILNVLTLQKEL